MRRFFYSHLFLFLSIPFILAMVSNIQAKEIEPKIAHAPALKRFTKIDRIGETILPNGRIVSPYGRTVMVAPHPYGLCLSPDGKTLVTANSGTRPFSLSILTNLDFFEPNVRQIPPGYETNEGILNAVFMGLAIAPDNKTLYASGGDDGSVLIFDLESGERQGEISANGTIGSATFEDSYLGDLKLSKDGSTLYVVDQANFRLVIMDTASQKAIESVKVGRYPFGICLSQDERRAYIANVGMFEYSLVEGYDPESPDKTGISFPAFAFGSEEARDGTTVDGKFVPGLGDPNAPESFSVWAVDITRRGHANVVAKVKTGILVGEKIEGIPAVGGSSPNSLVVDDEFIYVSNGTNDSISVIDQVTHVVVDTIQLHLCPEVSHLRGIIPFGLAIDSERNRLYIAESGINAVGVIDTKTRQLVAHIPVGWFPSKLALSPDGSHLYVANAKGLGSGPNAGPHFVLTPAGTNVGSLMRGVVSIFRIPPDNLLPFETKKVIRNNAAFTTQRPWLNETSQETKALPNPIPPYPGAYKSPIQHIVFITKENRTFDEVFGERQGALGLADIARYGLNADVRKRNGDAIVSNVNVMPNHQALADRFGISDNFYCDSDHSADGHRWLVGTYPNEWVETSVSASYGGRREFNAFSGAPGRRAMTGASGAIYPEDYNEAGSIWEHFERNQIDFFNFGLGFEFNGSIEEQRHRHTGVMLSVNYPVPGPLLDRTSRIFATYNTNVPDQFRVDMFEREFQQRWLSGNELFPRVLTMMLPNDHGAGERPEDGYPYVASYMADNDLALGRVIEILSNSPWWEHMAIVVTEDDAQGGVDHVDAHRSILMVISPYAKKNYVSHVHTSFGSIIKTFELILDIPYLNQFDGMASDLSDLFSAEADFTPYKSVPVDSRIFDPAKALDPMDREFDWDHANEYPVLDHPEIMQEWAKQEERERLGLPPERSR